MTNVATAIGLFYLWTPHDPLPRLSRLPAVQFSHEDTPAEHDGENDVELVTVQGEAESPAVRRYGAGAGRRTIALGEVSRERASIGELGIDVPLPTNHRYLWGFETLSDWRGRGIYPRLLQAILRQEQADGATHCWIGHDVGNNASERGIVRAGFTVVTRVDRLPTGTLTLVPLADTVRSALCASVFQLPLATD